MKRRLLYMATSLLMFGLIGCAGGNLTNNPNSIQIQSSSTNVSSSLQSVSSIDSSNTSSIKKTDAELIYERVKTAVENCNYSARYTLNDTLVDRKFLPSAYYNISSGRGYAENDDGIFEYGIYKGKISVASDYEKNNNELLKGLYSVKVPFEDRVNKERYFVNSLQPTIIDGFKNLKKSGNTNMYTVAHKYVFDILVDSADIDMFRYDTTTKIGLKDDGLVIDFVNKWATEFVVSVEIYDIGTTKIDEITTYLNEGKGAGDLGNGQIVSSDLDIIKSLMVSDNYLIESENLKRYVTSDYSYSELINNEETTKNGFVKIPLDNSLSLDAGLYPYTVESDAVVLGNIEDAAESTLNGGYLSPTFFNRFTINSDGVYVYPNGLLSGYTEYFAPFDYEQNYYITAATMSLNIDDCTEDDWSDLVISLSFTLIEDVKEDAQTKTINATISNFNKVTVALLDEYIETLTIN